MSCCIDVQAADQQAPIGPFGVAEVVGCWADTKPPSTHNDTYNSQVTAWMRVYNLNSGSFAKS